MLSRNRLSKEGDPISVRTARLNNIILGKGLSAGAAASSKVCATATGGTSSAIRRSLCYGMSSGGLNAIGNGNGIISTGFVDALNREGLLDALNLLYEECDKESLKKRDRNIAEFVKKYRPIIEETRRLRLNADDFVVRTLIGQGYFGTVHLVIEKCTGDVYAMKRIKKPCSASATQLKEERDIMSRRCSEWITNLQYAFQDTQNLYLIMEYLPGGDLLSLMSRHGPFDEELARFYLAELTQAIHALHNMGYVHRDIKPENILIDRFGHLKLADFGNAAALDRDGHVLSLSPVGTPDYIAPELLQTLSTYKLTKSLHSVSCDFWSMGIIGYEMIYEVTPFYEENVHETYSKILSHCDDSSMHEIVSYPNEVKITSTFKNLLNALITGASKRLDYNRIRRHGFFANISWDRLREEVPPIIPAVSSDADTTNFDVGNIRNNAKNNNSSINNTTNKVFLQNDTTTTSGNNKNIKTNDFSGHNLPYIGYSYCCLTDNDDNNVISSSASIETTTTTTMAKLISQNTVQQQQQENKLEAKMTELQNQLRLRIDEITELKGNVLRAEQLNRRTDVQSQLLQNAKDELHKMKEIIKEKTVELAACKTQIKTLQGAVKIEEEMWQKKESTITDLLRQNRQKYEEAKNATEQRYEKLIAEKRMEISNLMQQLQARDAELSAKLDECQHLQANVEQYRLLLQQHKQKNQAHEASQELSKSNMIATHDQQLNDLRAKLHKEQDGNAALAKELRDLQQELHATQDALQSTHATVQSITHNNDDLLQRLNHEIQNNNAENLQRKELEQKLLEAQKQIADLQHENSRLERELQVSECGRNLITSTILDNKDNHNENRSPYQTARGSMCDLNTDTNYSTSTSASVSESHCHEDQQQQLRMELEAAKESEDAHKRRADNLQETVEKLEQMLKRIDENASALNVCSKTANSHDGKLLERQNEKLEDKLAAVREEAVLERQAARTANLNLWKVEKQLDEMREEKKVIQRRLELTQERIKRVAVEHEETKNESKQAHAELKMREERIKELKGEVSQLKREVQREHTKWERSEEERLKGKSELIEKIASVQKLQERVNELQQKMQQTQIKSDAITMDNKHLQNELKIEQQRHATATHMTNTLQTQLKQMQSRYEQLKHACTVTDNQLTEVENLLTTEQNRLKAQQSSMDKMHINMRAKDESLAKLQRQLNEEQSARKAAESQATVLTNKHAEEVQRVIQLTEQLSVQQAQQLEQQQQLYGAQERIEVLTQECQQQQQLIDNRVQELNLLKEEHARILTELFYAKEEAEHLQNELKNAQQLVADLQADIDELQNMLTEKQQFYMQRDIKAEATLAQYKKLIDYLQVKNEDFMQSHKKKKSLTDRLFGTAGYHNNATTSSGSSGGIGSGALNSKENITPAIIESSILYRTLQAELNREKQHCKSLQEQVDKLTGKQSTTTLRSPLKNYNSNKINNEQQQQQKLMKTPTKQKQQQQQQEIKKSNDAENTKSSTNNNNKKDKTTTTTPKTNNSNSKEQQKSEKKIDMNSGKYTNSATVYHRFELCIAQESDLHNNKHNDDHNKCLACEKILLAGSGYWKCKVCKRAVHRKCRGAVSIVCSDGGIPTYAADKIIEETHFQKSNDNDNDDGNGNGNDNDNGNGDNDSDSNENDNEKEEKIETEIKTTKQNVINNGLRLVLDVKMLPDVILSQTLEINCAYEMEEQRILLLGCSTGLYALHMPQVNPNSVATPFLIHIAIGIDSAICSIAISTRLAKAILVGAQGESLYQCDYRQLLSRCCSQVNSCLEATVLDLPFANRCSDEKWQLVRISNETDNALDSVAIAATSTRIVILKYDMKMQQFKPVRALDTATSVTSILYTRHTAIVASDKFYEIDLDNYAAEEFVDVADATLSHAREAHPIIVIRMSRHEFLLCYMEFGIFVDEFGCRSRPYDLTWQYTPTGFVYRAPILYVAHYQSVQLIRLKRSYTQSVLAATKTSAATTTTATHEHNKNDNDYGGNDVDDDENIDEADDVGETTPNFQRLTLPFYTPTLLTDSGKNNIYILALNKQTGLQQLYYLDAGRALKALASTPSTTTSAQLLQRHDSLETISSVATSLTIGSTSASESTLN